MEGIEKRQTTRFPTCDTIDTGDIANFIACFNYLNGLGRKACEVKGGVTFCTAGNALVGGVNVGGGTTSSYWYVKCFLIGFMPANFVVLMLLLVCSGLTTTAMSMGRSEVLKPQMEIRTWWWRPVGIPINY